MAAPTLADLKTWNKLTGTADDAQLQEALDAARPAVEGRCRFPDDPAKYPPEMRTAVLMLASRLWRRQGSPEGVAGFGDLGIIRVLSSDPDVENLIAPYLRLDGFS